MNKLTKARRNQLAALVLGTVAVISCYWYFIILTQEEWLETDRIAVKEAQEKIEVGNRNAAKLDEFREEVSAGRREIRRYEADMASGDVYRWIIRTLGNFQKSTSVEFIDTEPPKIGEAPVPPKRPYQSASFVLTGKATYHEFGKFLADLENRFIHMRLQRLDLDPAHPGDPNSEDAEKLLFKMEISVLVAPVAPRE
jgi:hypothetical protein